MEVGGVYNSDPSGSSEKGTNMSWKNSVATEGVKSVAGMWKMGGWRHTLYALFALGCYASYHGFTPEWAEHDHAEFDCFES